MTLLRQRFRFWPFLGRFNALFRVRVTCYLFLSRNFTFGLFTFRKLHSLPSLVRWYNGLMDNSLMLAFIPLRNVTEEMRQEIEYILVIFEKRFEIVFELVHVDLSAFMFDCEVLIAAQNIGWDALLHKFIELSYDIVFKIALQRLLTKIKLTNCSSINYLGSSSQKILVRWALFLINSYIDYKVCLQF